MKKVRIITFHPGLNYGAVLQAFALSKVLEKLDLDVQIIDYRPFALMRKYYRFFVKPQTLFSRLLQHYNFHVFRKKHLAQTKIRYKSFEELVSKKVEADYLICGSDQVWNTAIFQKTDFSYFLAFAQPQQKKIAYAASLGAHPFPQKDKHQIKNILTDFHKISVREIFAKKQVEDLINKPTDIALDPTLLFKNFDDYLKVSAKMPSNYILVYAIEYSSFLRENVKRAKQLLNMPVVNISSWYFKDADYNPIGISPNEWLGWFSKASYVVTNSFHGTAFSLIFNRNFSFISIEKAIGLNNRIIDLLESLNATNRIVYLKSDGILENNIEKKMDYNLINLLLEKVRNKSMNFLNEALELN